ncbi:MAG: hypothetical protein M0P42_15515, partial [Gallionella sp.]|nr:hypothetical protein [Gallionella sp.]
GQFAPLLFRSSAAPHSTLPYSQSRVFLRRDLRHRADYFANQSVVINKKELGDAYLGLVRYTLASSIYEQAGGDFFNKRYGERGIGQLFNKGKKSLDLMSPSAFLSPFDFVKDMTVFIAAENFTKVAAFNSNSNNCWIVKDTEIVCAKSGTEWDENPSEGWQIFSTTLGDRLEERVFLEPFQSIDIQTVNHQIIGEIKIQEWSKFSEPDNLSEGSAWLKPFRYIHKGAAVVSNFGISARNLVTNTVGGVLDAQRTIGSSPYKLVYQPDGNLVLYKVSGATPTPQWSTKTNGRPAWRACMQDDGNFVVYSAPGKVAWALWKEMPSDSSYKGASIRLHPTSGRPGYYKKEKSTPEFYLDTCESFLFPA